MKAAIKSCLTGLYLIGLFSGSFAIAAIDDKKLTIGDEERAGGAPYFYGTFDAAGFSDWIWYGQSPLHPYGFHELLSGEWGAAIYYDGIDTPSLNDPNRPNEHEAMWLTRLFEYPDWSTNSTFTAPGVCAASHNPNNPTPLNNSGKSFITNGVVEITVDYEVVDLEGLGATYSPMSYYADPNSVYPTFMYSDRYVFLQTYTVRNITGQTLTNLEFYQFLHSHGADEYGPRVNSTYCDANLQDPLANYIPYNPVHQAGNFRYDITQWNGPHTTSSHVDFVSFSSTIEPDWIDTDTFNGHSGKPPYGTHINIEKRRLNGIDRIYHAEVGGAMGWSMGSLDPNETVSLTVAYMFGPQQETESLILVKEDDVPTNQCVQPGDELEYTITFYNVGAVDAENAELYDYLPAGVTYPEGAYRIGFGDPGDPNEPPFYAIPPDPAYDPETHSYRWTIGTIPAYESGSRSIRVVVNSKAEPGMLMQNKAVLTSSIGQVSTQWGTRICCWDQGGIIYVDSRATGANIGTSWQNAYTDLQRALARAATGCGAEIWVAQGTYDPGRETNKSFTIPEGVSVYGGFAGNETSRYQRNPRRYKSILTGAADNERNETVVRMLDSTLLDGFTVTGAAESGIYGSNVDFTVSNCTIENSWEYGVRVINGNLTLNWCTIRNNWADGIRHDGENSILNIENCWIMKNMQYGIFSQNSTPIVKNSIVSESDLEDSGRAGIRMVNPTYMPVLHNNTFAHNRNVGVSFVDNRTLNDPNDRDWPDVQNCILWYNNNNGPQFTGFGKQYIYHSCIYDPNDPHGEDMTPDVNYNFSANPAFIYIDPNNVRVAGTSPCVDAGNRLMSYDDQLDMDGRVRVLGDYVDVGAYEVDPECQSDGNIFDWNADGLVNLVEFNLFSRAWLSHDPNDPTWLADPNLADPNLSEGWYEWKHICNLDITGDSAYSIDLADLMVFLEQVPWLWQACWKTDVYWAENSQPEMLMFAAQEDILFTRSRAVETASMDAVLAQQQAIQDQISDLAKAAFFLEKLWLEEPDIQQQISPDDWQRFIDAIYNSSIELQIGAIQIE